MHELRSDTTRLFPSALEMGRTDSPWAPCEFWGAVADLSPPPYRLMSFTGRYGVHHVSKAVFSPDGLCEDDSALYSEYDEGAILAKWVDIVTTDDAGAAFAIVADPSLSDEQNQYLAKLAAIVADNSNALDDQQSKFLPVFEKMADGIKDEGVRRSIEKQLAAEAGWPLQPERPALDSPYAVQSWLGRLLGAKSAPR